MIRTQRAWKHSGLNQSEKTDTWGHSAETPVMSHLRIKAELALE